MHLIYVEVCRPPQTSPMVLGCSPTTVCRRTGGTTRGRVAIFEYIVIFSAFPKVVPKRATS